MTHLPDADLPSFLVAPCSSCGVERLGARALGEDKGQGAPLIWVCAHCDEALPQGRWVTARELDALDNYHLGSLLPAPKHGSGCRGGQCGVRQPGADRA